MNPQVLHQGRIVAEALATCWTDHRLVPRVDLLMGLKVKLAGKQLSALRADVRLFPAVHPLVGRQAGFVGEALATFGTGKGLLPRVGAEVLVEVGEMGKALSAVRAHEMFRPSSRCVLFNNLVVLRVLLEVDVSRQCAVVINFIA